MNDIAEASDKGRRTVYTYFKNKREIYNAILESETESLVASLRAVVEAEMPPLDKLARYLDVRFDFLSALAPRSNNFIASFFMRDLKRVDKVRRMALMREKELFRAVVDQGVLSGDFDIEQAHRLAAVESTMFKGIDYAVAAGETDIDGRELQSIRREIISFIVKGVRRRDPDTPPFAHADIIP